MPDRSESSSGDAPPPVDAAPANLRWKLGGFVLDERRLELTRGGERIVLESKPLQLLLALVRRAGEVVTKDELLEQVWPARVPSESVLTKAMAKLRVALEDEDQQLIRTVYGFGYRLVADVSIDLDPTMPAGVTTYAPGDVPPQRPNWRMVRQLTGGNSDVWLVRNEKTGEQRVFKFAASAEALRNLKREITLFRVLNDSRIDPNGYVRVIDWSLDEAPYFLESEFAVGGSLPDWIEAQGGFSAVPLARRLECFLQAARAIAAAHDAGVLHKDLKPGNLLMGTDEHGALRVKLGDFGSGQVLDAEQLQRLAITRMGFTQAVPADDSTSGTPLYLAPELLAGHVPSVRSDIYALGVILYQLVVGDFRRPIAPGWERDVDDELLRDDIARAVDGNPVHRLGDAASLAQRVQDLAARRAQLAAEREAAAERARLATRLVESEARRRYLRLAVAALVVGLVSAGVLAARLLVAERGRTDALARARNEAATSEQVSRYLVSLFDAASPENAGGRPIDPRAFADRGQALLSGSFGDQPVLRARLLATVGSLYCKLGHADPCTRNVTAALALDAKHPQPEPAARIEFQYWLAQAQLANGDNVAAERTLQDALTATGRLAAPPPQLQPLLLKSLGDAFHAQFKSRESVDALERARHALESSGQQGTALHVQVLGALALSYQDAAREPDAYRLATETIGLVREQRGERGLAYYDALYMYGAVLGNLDRYSEAAIVLKDVREGYVRLYGAENALTVEAQNDYARALLAIGRFSEAAALAERSLDGQRRVVGPDVGSYAETAQLLGRIRFFQGDYAESVRLLGESHRHKLATRPAGDLDTINTGYDLARPLIFLQRLPEARALLAREVPATETSAYSKYMRGMRLRWRGELATAAGDFAGAHRDLDDAARILLALKPADGTVLMKLRESVGSLLAREGRNAEAVAELRAVLAGYRRLFPPDSALTRGVELRLAAVLTALHESDEARRLLTSARPVLEKELLAGNPLRRELERLTP